MYSNTIVVNQEAPYSAYKQLASDCSFIRYLHWDNQIPEIDEFLDEAIACRLATALVASGRVLFLLSDDAGVSSEGWIKLAGESWRVTRQLGRFPGLRDSWQLCFSREPATVQELFYDAKCNWHLRGQIALLFPTDQAPENLDLHSVLTAIKNQDLRGLPDYLGYLRPGDDGDFAELGMLGARAFRGLSQFSTSGQSGMLTANQGVPSKLLMHLRSVERPQACEFS